MSNLQKRKTNTASRSKKRRTVVLTAGVLRDTLE